MARECFYMDKPIVNMESTHHYQLPQWKSETITSWLTQMNYAMQRVDDVLWSIALRTGINGMPDDTIEEVVRLSYWSEQAEGDINIMEESLESVLISQGNLQTQITSIQTRLETITTNLVNLDTRMSTLESRMENLQMGLEKVENNLNGLTERVEELETKEE